MMMDFDMSSNKSNASPLSIGKKRGRKPKGFKLSMEASPSPVSFAACNSVTNNIGNLNGNGVFKEEVEESDEETVQAVLGKSFYIVEAIRGKRYNKGKLQYLVKWKNYSESENTWEPYDNIRKCVDIVKEFELRSSSPLPIPASGGRGRKRRKSMEKGHAESFGEHADAEHYTAVNDTKPLVSPTPTNHSPLNLENRTTTNESPEKVSESQCTNSSKSEQVELEKVISNIIENSAPKEPFSFSKNIKPENNQDKTNPLPPIISEEAQKNTSQPHLIYEEPENNSSQSPLICEGAQENYSQPSLICEETQKNSSRSESPLVSEETQKNSSQSQSPLVSEETQKKSSESQSPICSHDTLKSSSQAVVHTVKCSYQSVVDSTKSSYQSVVDNTTQPQMPLESKQTHQVEAKVQTNRRGAEDSNLVSAEQSRMTNVEATLLKNNEMGSTVVKDKSENVAVARNGEAVQGSVPQENGCNGKENVIEDSCMPMMPSQPRHVTPITRINKAINYCKCSSDGKPDIRVTFKAQSSDGEEVIVDNKYLRLNNPTLLLDFYEQHLRYSSSES